MNCLRWIGLFLCVMVLLSLWGCLPEPSPQPLDFDQKLYMLENNETY